MNIRRNRGAADRQLLVASHVPPGIVEGMSSFQARKCAGALSVVRETERPQVAKDVLAEVGIEIHPQ